ncbi:hypothetical protein [Amycolatopsis albispora]|uniref:Phosphatidic acid phosphatase type 2/haloperoxidase domain-containing protein n=1 Tax=Amycolatopsis albispora TaxID=1804986 RepID=A0A344L5B2_9PSEU|nr:hypothetical protein [Amycolatopsis albispora]AXB43236.1 hypothetical protein A4R43_12310 [Amycolatopsis albispora]
MLATAIYAIVALLTIVRGLAWLGAPGRRLILGTAVRQRAEPPTFALSMTVGQAIAQLITSLASPPVLLATTWLLLGAGTGALGDALVAIVATAVVPVLVIAIGIRRGWWIDRYIDTRPGRLICMAAIGCSLVAGFLALRVARASLAMQHTALAMTIALAGLLLTTIWWKISVHTTVAAGCAAMLTFALGAPWLATLLIVPIIAWSRLALRSHTIAQVLAGTALGLLATIVVFR